MNNNYNWNNPLMAQQQTQTQMQNYYQMAPKYSLNEVKGEAGANNFRMAPNSQTILVDLTAPMIWFAQTDSGGYLSVEPYDIFPHKKQAPVNVNDLEERVRRLEEQYVQQSNTTKPRKSKPVSTESTNAAVETNGSNV